jgi:hypothetical protein
VTKLVTKLGTVSYSQSRNSSPSPFSSPNFRFLIRVAFAGADVVAVIDRQNEYAAVADLTRSAVVMIAFMFLRRGRR